MMNLRDTPFFSRRLTTFHAEFSIMAIWHAFHSLSRFYTVLQIAGFYSLRQVFCGDYCTDERMHALYT